MRQTKTARNLPWNFSHQHATFLNLWLFHMRQEKCSNYLLFHKVRRGFQEGWPIFQHFPCRRDSFGLHFSAPDSGGRSACCRKWQPQSPQPYLSVTSRLPRPKMCVGSLRLSSKHGDTPPSSTSVIETQQLWGASQRALNLQAVCHYLHSGVTDCHLATNCICVLSRCLAIPYKVRGGHVRGVSCQLSTECHGGSAGSRPSIHNGRTLVTLCHHHLVDALRAAPGLGPLSSSCNQ